VKLSTDIPSLLACCYNNAVVNPVGKLNPEIQYTLGGELSNAH